MLMPYGEKDLIDKDEMKKYFCSSCQETEICSGNNPACQNVWVNLTYEDPSITNGSKEVLASYGFIPLSSSNKP